MTVGLQKARTVFGRSHLLVFMECHEQSLVRAAESTTTAIDARRDSSVGTLGFLAGGFRSLLGVHSIATRLDSLRRPTVS
jgi:hypothetical protein